MELPRSRISVRCSMLLVAIAAVLVVGGHRLIVGDGVAVEFANGLGRPIRDIRLACNGGTIGTNELLPGNVTRGRLWPATIRRGERLDGEFDLSFSLDGRVYRFRLRHTFDLLYGDPNVRWNVMNEQEPDAFYITDTGDPPISRLKRLLPLAVVPSFVA